MNKKMKAEKRTHGVITKRHKMREHKDALKTGGNTKHRKNM